MDRRRGLVLLMASAALGLLALASNVTTTAQLSGEANDVLAARLIVSKLVNSGTVWAGIGIVAGWWVGRWTWAILGAVVASETALAVHYAVGEAVGMYDDTVWLSNVHWFIAALIVGPVLGVIGSLARRAGALGTAAALALPLGALIEPFLLGMFTMDPIFPWPQRLATAVCGGILVVAGVVGAMLVLRSRAGSPRRRLEHPAG
ncbi:MAG: hypothetical protein KBB39_02785 [Phycicoccus sp.]|nr:hypothetical protein [Phycicoccus sp.]